MKPKLVEVEWTDARSVYEQFPLTTAIEKCTLVQRVTVGYVVLKDRERLLLAHTYDPPNEHEAEGGADFTVIPRGWVKEIRELQPATDGETKKEPSE